MKKLLFTTSHPAPYVDILLAELAKEYDLTVLYHSKISTNKGWKKLDNWPGVYMQDLGICLILKLIFLSDFVVFGGFASIKNKLLILITNVLNKEYAVFSDHPNPEEKEYKVKIKKVFFIFVKRFFLTSDSCIEYFNVRYNLPRNRLFLFPYNYKQADSGYKLNTKIYDRPINVLLANRFIERKGYAVVQKAFLILQQMGVWNEFHFMIVGNGDEFETYQYKWSSLNNVELLGWIEFEQYLQLMDTTDVFLHASLFEPFGIPPVDALARGKYVIVSSGVKSTDRLIVDDVSGYIYESENATQLVHKLMSARNRILNKKCMEKANIDLYLPKTNLMAISNSMNLNYK